MRPMVARYLGALHGQSILEDAGLAPARTQPFRDALAAGRVAADLVTDELMDAVAIAGTPAQCRAALARWASTRWWPWCPRAPISPGSWNTWAGS